MPHALARSGLALLAFVATSFVAVPAIVRADAPSTKPAEDADVALVRAAVVKTMPKVNAADVTPAATIESLGGRDITVIEILGELGERLGTPIDDGAVQHLVDTRPAKTMRGLSVRDLARLVKDARAEK